MFSFPHDAASVMGTTATVKCNTSCYTAVGYREGNGNGNDADWQCMYHPYICPTAPPPWFRIQHKSKDRYCTVP